jgi:putative restriction endonuclease
MIVAPITDDTRDTRMRMAAFEHVRRLGEIHDHLTETEMKPGFVFQGERIPLINLRRGIFKPQPPLTNPLPRNDAEVTL